MITGIVQTTKTNDYGYTSYKISSTWYGADTKGPPRASEGEKVSFEGFDKPGKEGKVYPTIKLATLKKVAKQTDSVDAGLAETSSPGPKQGAAANRDTYWADKATEDAKKDPRIVYQSSYERAILFTKLALDSGSFEALAKAKATARLEILTAFVDEQADRIMKAVYAAKVPAADTAKVATAIAVATIPQATDESEQDESWS